MGLGLSICQTIMRHHTGTMEIGSQQNEWTEVTLSLPSHIKLIEYSTKPNSSNVSDATAAKKEFSENDTGSSTVQP